MSQGSTVPAVLALRDASSCRPAWSQFMVRIQREGDVVHLVDQHLTDLSAELAR